MKKKYKETTRAKRQQLQALRIRFELLMMNMEESVMDYFSLIMTIINKMRIHDDKIEDITIIEKNS
jgi:hypothetical protein